LAEKIYNLQGNSEGFEVGVFTVRFGSVFINKINKPNFLKKKPKPVQTDRFWFGSVRFLEKKPVQTGLARFFRFGSVLARFWLGLARFWLGFFPVFFSVRFGFSGSRLKKPKPNRTGRFFQNFNRFNRFFFTVRFFRLFFFRFFGFFKHP
jgi:hypothetical protein